MRRSYILNVWSACFDSFNRFSTVFATRLPGMLLYSLLPRLRGPRGSACGAGTATLCGGTSKGTGSEVRLSGFEFPSPLGNCGYDVCDSVPSPKSG